jgi:hypothetical protein
LLVSEHTLSDTFGPAQRPDRAVAHPRPDGLPDESVAALGRLSAALEVVEHARGHLYAFHRLSGTADLAVQDAVEKLRTAGHAALAEDIEQTLVGRDVVEGHWTFEVVEEYDARYWSVFRACEEHARAVLGAAEPHIFEAETKHREQS